MENTMREHRRVSKLPIIILSVLLAAVIGVTVWLTVWVVQLNTMSDLHNAQTENAYEDALFQTSDGLSNVENDLAKLLITQSSSQSAMYATDICKNAAATADAAARLPVSYEDTTKIQKFLNQVSDFAATYVRISAEGGDLGKYDEQIESLYKTAKALKQKVSGITAQFDGSYSIIDNIGKDGFYADLSGGEDTESSVEYPRVIYDGPFSDSLDDIKFKAVEGKPDISEQEAVTLAAENYGLQNAQIIGITGETALIYQMIGTINGREASVGLTVKGGMLANLDISSTPGAVKYDQEYASEFAVKQTLEYGFCKDLTPVWYNQLGGTAFVNLAPVKDDIIYYTDLVKVTVNLTDGSLISIEARAYCCNYCERDASNVMDEDAVPTLVSKKLTIKSIRLAVIPKGQKEALCYEVASEMNDLDYFVYLDAVTGKEVEILRVIDEDQGAMVY